VAGERRKKFKISIAFNLIILDRLYL